jgi:uncharacterized damage-inducible protein DinB
MTEPRRRFTPHSLLSYKHRDGILSGMELNPYAKFLGDRDPIEVLDSTCVQLTRLADRLPQDQFTLRPPSGKWSAREIVAHLADCELVFSFRLRQALAEDGPTIQPFDQDHWAARYGNHDMASGLRLFAAAREWNLMLLGDVTPAERERQTTHPERGTMTLWTIVETMAGHDINHLQQIERLATLD